jgi:lipoate-protein ligase A
MGRDEELLLRADGGEPGLRVYTWDGPWVSLGRFQQPRRALLRPEDTLWVMRPTGGKSVLHGHDLTVGLALPLALLGLADSRRVAPAYRAVIGPIVRAMRSLGAEAVLGEETQLMTGSLPTSDCFAHVSPNDVVHPVSGQKLVGCALRITDRAVLVQASIPSGPPLVEPGSVFDSPHLAAWTPGLDPRRLHQALLSELDRTLLAQ